MPQQIDGNECGNFVLYFINLFLRCAPENFSMDGYPYFVSYLFCVLESYYPYIHFNSVLFDIDMLQMKKDWFTFEDFDRFCERLDSLN